MNFITNYCEGDDYEINNKLILNTLSLILFKCRIWYENKIVMFLLQFILKIFKRKI